MRRLTNDTQKVKLFNQGGGNGGMEGGREEEGEREKNRTVRQRRLGKITQNSTKGDVHIILHKWR